MLSRPIQLVGILLLAMASIPFHGSGLHAAKPKILMVTQSEGFRHQPVKRERGELASSELAMRQLAKRSGEFVVHFTQDVAAEFTREKLQDYQIVIFYTSGDLPIGDEHLDYFLGDWLHQAGHGLIGFHSATDTYKNHQPYWDLIGGTFAGHPWGQNSRVTIAVHDVDHPAVKPFDAEFEFQDEIYQYDHWQPEKVRVLMSLDMGKTELKRPYHVPVAWAKQVGDGRLFYSNLGHRPQTWENETFMKSVLGAIRWVSGAEDGDASPNPAVSAAQHRRSEEESAKAGITKESLQAEKEAREARQRAKRQQAK